MKTDSQPITPQTPPQPVAATLTSEQILALKKSNKLKLVWGLICLIGPTALLLITIMSYAVINFVAAQSITSDGVLFAPPSIAHTVANVVMFLIGALATLTWLPGIVIGIILLAQRQRA